MLNSYHYSLGVIIALALAACAGLSSCGKKPAPLKLVSDCGGSMNANALDRCTVELKGGDPAARPEWVTIAVVDASGHAAPEAADIIEKSADKLTIQSTISPCEITVAARRGKIKKVLKIKVAQDTSDADADGFPDVAELNMEKDRQSFRMWFATIAESQALHMSDAWNDESHDCAGLVRFAYREALRVHDSKALEKFKSLTRTDIPDVAKFNYPSVPMLGENLFRTKRGEFKMSDLKDGAFSPFVTARLLQEANTQFVSKSLDDAQPGDVMFFLHFDDTTMPYHTMIFLGAKPSEEEPMLVYHTGPVHNTQGRIKLIPVSVLMDFPDERWRPVPENEFFMGVYRFNILD